MLSWVEHEKSKKKKKKKNVSILRFISKINFMLSWVEHEKSFTTSGPELVMLCLQVIRRCLHIDKIHKNNIHSYIALKSEEFLFIICWGIEKLLNEWQTVLILIRRRIWSGSALFVQTYLSDYLGYIRFMFLYSGFIMYWKKYNLVRWPKASGSQLQFIK